MPELPDVETFKRYLDATSLHKTINAVRVGDDEVLRGVSRQKLQAVLKERSLKTTHRHGKYLFARLNADGWLVLHFGMTGYLRYFKDPKEIDQHDRVVLRFSNGFHLAYSCQRKLGAVSLAKSLNEFIESKELGPDALDLSFSEFREQLGRSRGSIKSALMNQKLLAGIGNEYSDEVLFQARTHPKTPTDEIKEKQLRQLHRTLRRVLRSCIERQADPERFPRTYLNRRREEGAPCPRCRGKVRTLKVSGRTAYYCPHCQRQR